MKVLDITVQRKSFLVIGVMTIIALAGCGAPKHESVTPLSLNRMMDDLRLGNITLDCEFDCLWSHLTERESQHALYLSGKYEELAVSIMKVGLKRDLPYFYLGVCAENLGYFDAADKFFQESRYFFKHGASINRCKDEIHCNGIKIDSEISEHLSILKRANQRLGEAVDIARAYETEMLAYQESHAKQTKSPTPKKKNR